ncbi:MAG: glycosyltransferase [Acidimicrobiales bacterium]
MSRPIVITGGGTGGHVFPMQAVAEQLEVLGVDAERIRFVGSRRGQEADLLAGGAIALTLLPGRGLRRSLAWSDLASNVVAVAGLLGAVGLALVKVARWRPSVVVSVGGYASFGAAFAAVVWRRPLVLVELDAAPGAAQRALTRFASWRCTAFETSEPRTTTTGPPLREAIVHIDRSEAARHAARAAMSPPIEEGRAVVVVMTGSLGSRRVNDAVSQLARSWGERSDRTLIHVTGRRDFPAVEGARPATSALDYRIVPFADMAQLWSVCDVAVCRSGAITIGELTALGIASVLIPLPGAPGDHQVKNAVAVASAGGATVLRDGDVTEASLAEALDRALDDDRLPVMSAAARSLGRRDAAREIAEVVLRVGGS